MKQQTVTYVIIGLLGGTLLGMYISAYAVNTRQSGMMQMMGIQTNKLSGSSGDSEVLDRHFIEQMVPHHEDAVTMANLALQKAKKQEVKTMAKNIISSQTNEIKEMKDWYRKWYGAELPTGSDVMSGHGMMNDSGMHMGMMGSEADNSRLANAADFDKAFIEEMIPHHQMAVMMASMLKNGSKRPELTKLADDIISAQSDEISQMRTWYNQWYK